MNPKRSIVVLDDYENFFRSLADWSEIDRLADVRIHSEPLLGDALVSALKDADAIVLMRDRTPFRAELIDRLPKLKYVVFTGTRNSQLDFERLKARGIAVSCTEGGPAKESTTELTWALILAASKHMESQFALIRNGGWRDATPISGALLGERLGVVGLGGIGSRVAKVGLAFGMDVVTWSPHMTDARAAAHGARFVPFDELLKTSKVVTLHLVPGTGTRGLMSVEKLALMRDDAMLVNTSRAALIDMPALVRALASGRPAVAALDVYEQEPMPADHPLRSMANAVLTPHIGYVTLPIMKGFARGVVEDLAAWLKGEPLLRPVTPTA